jgi:hypothetical protein
MKTNIATKLGLSLFALGLGVAPTLAETTAPPAKPAHAKPMHAKAGKPAKAAPLSATEQLNADSLAAAQANKEYVPAPAAAPAPMKSNKM